ncbi:hypothetical protein [Enterovibrio norvegicus]|uniref:hypothetical protein n=1 Tax=Enterovibrio norvegicus TaxID=188144 RepID=UPI000C85D56F|nr:hypothetical protein [Enterovibrio norvegicus]PMN70508.1 hypothetical protein BCT27_01985 [Enterovibrio norvegicus]
MSRVIDPRYLQPEIDYILESFETVLERYNNFGSELITESISMFGDNLVFLKDPTTDDVWAFCEGQFGFQIDPDIEIVIIWQDKINFIEFGEWLETPVKDAINLLESLQR